MSSAPDEPVHHPQARTIAKIRKRFQSLGNRALAICAVVTFVVCLLEIFNLPPLHPQLSDAELRLQDHFLLLRNYLYPNGEWKNDALGDVVMISADRDSARRLGISDSQPIRESLVGQLVQKLADAKASVIVLDIPLEITTEVKQQDKLSGEIKKPPVVASEKNSAVSDDQQSAESTPSQDETTALAAQLKHAKNVILTSGIDRTPTESSRANSLVLLRSPGAPFVEAVGEDSGSIGNNVIIADQDGLVRHGTLLFDQLGPSFYKSISLRIIEKKLGTRSIVDDSGKAYLRDRLLPKNVRINYAGPPGTFRTIPLWRALEWEKHAQHGYFTSSNALTNDDKLSLIDANNPFKDKIVLFGVFDPQNPSSMQEKSGYGSSSYCFLTPAAPPPTPMSGIEIQANLSDNILHRTFLAEPDEWEVLLLIVFIGLLTGRVLGKYTSRPWVSVAVVAVVSLVWLALSFSAYLWMRILIPVVVPLVGVAYPATFIVLLDQRYKIKRERAKQTRLFRSLAAKPLANEIERKLLAELGLTGRVMNVTVAACQLHDFSRDFDDRSPELVLQSLNQCLGVMMATIGEHGGLVERVWNCGVIGLWGAPIAMDGAAQVDAAANCIKEMRLRLKQLENSSQGGSKTPFGLSCSLNSGDAICGTIDAGSKDSSLVQYGALGPTIDLAMQLDSFNSKYGTSCIVGGATAKLLESRSELRELDRVEIGSQSKVHPIYELLSVDGSLPGIFEEAMDLYRKGRAAYDNGNFREAEQLFATCTGMVPDDRATALMLERCRNVLEHSTTTH